MKKLATGKVIKAFGNLLHISFEGDVCQGEVVMIKLEDLSLKGEVIEIVGDVVKAQIFEDTWGIQLGTPVEFQGHLLEAELGPGLLGSIIDGLQTPLEKVAAINGILLKRGIHIPSLDRTKKWNYRPTARVGDLVYRGKELGVTMEGRFQHSIMVPFSLRKKYTLTWVCPEDVYTVDTTVAKGVDEEGVEYIFTMIQKWPVKTPLCIGEKNKSTEMMSTGERILDTQFPILKGGTFCSPGPFGAGKTVLQHHLAKYSSVDIVIFVACGERAGEVIEVLKTFPHLIDPHTNDPLMNRTVIVCNTSSMPVASREASIYMGATIAEYYRQMGFDVLLLADSTSRWAQAMREMSGRLEEIPGDEAFPAYLASRIASFYERSGVIQLEEGKKGSLTICGTVSPAGGNFEEPVTQATLAVVGAFYGLSQARSDARRYPAIDPLISWSKYVEDVSKQLEDLTRGWGKMVQHGAKILRHGDEIRKRMEVIGQEGITLNEMVIYLKSELYEFAYLQQNAFDKEDAYCPLERQVALFSLINAIFNGDFYFNSHDTASSFFISLQGEIKNMNFIPFKSDRYEHAMASIQHKIHSALKGIS